MKNTIWPSIIDLLSNVGIFGIGAYFIQKQIDKSSEKRLEEFKSTLGLILNNEKALHNKRLLIIEDLYERLVELDFCLKKITSPLKQASEDEEKQLQETSGAFQKFHLYFEKNKIYFGKRTCDKIHKIRDAIHNAIWDFNQPRMVKEHQIKETETVKQAYLDLKNAYKAIRDEIPKLREELETEFRQILNVN
jgi:hypothetical protein